MTSALGNEGLLGVGERPVDEATFRREAQEVADYVRVRLEQAQRLLCESRASVREVARRSGYGSSDGFARRFEAAFKVSPRAYRARFQGERP